MRPVNVHDYLIDQSGIDWSRILSGWWWLVPREFTLWLVNRFADLFLVFPDGSVHMLDVGVGSIAKVAECRGEFSSKIDQDDNANQWLMIPLVDDMVAAGMHLRPGECYGFKQPPVLGGHYTVENIGVFSIADYLGAYGSIDEQLRNVGDRERVVINLKKDSN
jgi:hypothetical protein